MIKQPKNTDVQDAKELYAEIKTDITYHLTQHKKAYLAGTFGLLAGMLVGVLGTLSMTNKNSSKDLVLKVEFPQYESMAANQSYYGPQRYI